MTKTIESAESPGAARSREAGIRRNVFLFFGTSITCFLSMFVVSRSGIEDFTKLLIVLAIVCVFFFVGLYFIARIFYLCFKAPQPDDPAAGDG